jgi:hypothetical protein
MFCLIFRLEVFVFCAEDEGIIFLQNVGTRLRDVMAFSNLQSINSFCKNYKSETLFTLVPIMLV